MNKKTTAKVLKFAKQFEGTKTYNEFLLFFEEIYHDILESNGIGYDVIHNLDEEGNLLVSADGKYGVVDSDFNTVVEVKYDTILEAVKLFNLCK